MNEPSNRGGDVALFIDWENFKISLAAGHMYPNVSALKEEASNHGRVVVAKAYADWVTRSPELRGASQFINDPPALYAAGIEPVYVPTRLSYGSPSASGYTRTTRVKNSVDIKMTTDCIETAHAYPNIVSFILVSGDSDFIHVINTLRTMGKHVVIVGVSWSTSRRLADQVDGLILYDVDVDPETPQEPPPPTRTFPRPDTGASTGIGSGTEQTAVPELTEIIRAIEDIVREERRAGGAPLLTSIKQRLTRRFTNFDERKLGFSGFKKLMARVAQEGQIKLITEGLVDWAIMADEPDPDGSTQRRPANGHRAPTALEPAATTETLEAAASDTEEPEPDLEAVLLVKQPDAPEPTSDSTLEQTPDSAAGAIYEPTPEATSPEFTPSQSEPSTPPPAPELTSLMENVMAELKDLPKQPEDGQTGDRIADLIVMANTLEHRDDVSHVAFNFLVGEVCQALEQGIEAENPYIQSRWGKAASRTYVSRLLRSMGNGDLFTKSWHSVPDEVSGRNKRRRTFYLDQENPLVKSMGRSPLRTLWQRTNCRWVPLRTLWQRTNCRWVPLRSLWQRTNCRWVPLRSLWQRMNCRWVPLRSLWQRTNCRWVPLRSLWQRMNCRWVPLRSLWQRTNCRWVPLKTPVRTPGTPRKRSRPPGALTPRSCSDCSAQTDNRTKRPRG